MVDISKDIFLESILNKNFSPEIDAASFEQLLNKYPAFNAAYLLESSWLNSNQRESFERKLAYTAVNVRDRAVLHDYICKNVFDNKEVKTIEIVAEETVQSKPEVTEEIETQNIAVQETFELKKEEEKVIIPKRTEAIEKTAEEKAHTATKIRAEENKEETISNEEIKEIESQKQDIVTETENKETKAVEIDNNDEISEEKDEKEQRRSSAMQALQDELFGAKANISDNKTDEKEHRRAHAMQKLQQELFEAKKAKPTFVKTEEKEIVSEKTDAAQTTIKELKVNETVKNTSPEINETQKLKEEIIEEKNPINLLKEAQEVKETKKQIEELLKIQEEKIKNLIEPQTFKEKETSLEFIDWLKLKKVSKTTEEEEKAPVKKEEATPNSLYANENNSIVAPEDDLVPFERTSVIEAEMHQEAKYSPDPLEHFISSEIIRKKKRKKNPQKTNTVKKGVIVSETLAEILTVQQKYSEAIDVYKLLSLKYPQKSIYFANQIEKIKNYL